MSNNVVAVLVLGVALLVGGCQGVISHTTKNTVEITVQEKERITTEDSGYYLVFSEEGEVFKNSDSFWVFKFNSSNVHAGLKVGEKYSCQVNWFRFGITSSYRNILKCGDAL